jgi:hypothetical protein
MAIAGVSLFGKRAVLLALFEKKPPFNPDQTVLEYSEILRSYGLTTVTGDRYAGSWPAERFAAHGIRYVPSEKTKSEIFLEFLMLVNSGRVRIPSDRRLRRQFAQLERKTSRGGRDHVDHPAGAFDDAANCAAGVLCLAARLMGKEPAEPWACVLKVPRTPRGAAPDYEFQPEDEKKFTWWPYK